MGMLDAIGHLEKIPFEETLIPELGTILWFQADFQVEADDGSYAFTTLQIYTQQLSPEGFEGYFPALLHTALQSSLDLELRCFLQSDQAVHDRLSELADQAGMAYWLYTAA